MSVVAGSSTPAAVCDAPVVGRAAAFVVLDRRAATDSVATLTVCLIWDKAHRRLAGYHGELAWKPASRIVRVDRPAGGTRIENTTVAGRASFAGVSSSGLDPGPLLALVIAQRRGPDDASIRLTLLGVTDVDGRDIRSQVNVDSLPRVMRQR